MPAAGGGAAAAAAVAPAAAAAATDVPVGAKEMCGTELQLAAETH